MAPSQYMKTPIVSLTESFLSLWEQVNAMGASKWSLVIDDEDILLGPQYLHTRHDLAFMQGVWWNFYVNG